MGVAKPFFAKDAPVVEPASVDTTNTGAEPRRRFLAVAVRAAAVPVVATWLLGRQLVPTRTVQAIRGRFYPGPVKRLSHAEIRRPGRWKG